VLGAALLIAQSVYLNGVPAGVLPADAAAAAFDILVRFASRPAGRGFPVQPRDEG
jgi:hypothetical protein